MATVIPNLFSRLIDANGIPIAGGKIYVYAAGTTTPATVYSDNATTIPLSNPIVADSGGAIVPIYAKDGTYKFVFNDASGATYYTVDNYSVVTSGGGGTSVSAPVVLKTANYTVQSTDRNAVIICDASAAVGQNIVITADSSGLGNGFPFSVVNIGSVGTVTVVGASGQLINVSSSFNLTSQNQSASFASNGASGWIVSASSIGAFINAVTFFAGAYFKAQVQSYEQTITWVSSPATTTFNPASGPDAVITLAGAAMILGPIANQSANVGCRGVIRFINGASGGFNVSFDSSYVMADGTAPAISLAANAETRLRYWVKSASVTQLEYVMPNGIPVLLNTLTASGSSSVQDTTSITSSYRYYRFVFENIVPATNGSSLLMQPQVAGSFQATVLSTLTDSSPSGNITNSALGPGFNSTTGQMTGSVSNVAGAGFSGELLLSNPSGTSNNKVISGFGAYYNGTNLDSIQIAVAYLGSQGAITGFKWLMSSGNISTGTIKIYGWN